MDDPKVTLAKARLEAAELRTRAAHQADQAASYRRQAKKPIAEKVESLAAENRARADLIEAEAEAAYRAATGQEPPEK